MAPEAAGRAFSFAAVILAAGASSRMGAPKLLLPWGARSVLGHLLALWDSLGAAQTAIVCACGGNPVSDELDRLGISARCRIVNPRPEEGMFGSVQAAARWPHWRTELTHFVIVLGDQPQVRTGTLRRVLEFAAAHPSNITQPSRAGRGRHPVILPEAQFRALAESGAPALNAYLRERASLILRCPLDDPALDVDLDTPADYTRALASFGPEIFT